MPSGRQQATETQRQDWRMSKVFQPPGSQASASAYGRKAIGIDGISKADYGNNLNANLENLIRKIRNGTYKPKPSRLVEIPKEDGSTRPLAISCTEDKLVQSAVHAILKKKITDKRFLALLRALIKAPTMQGDDVIANALACTQGSILSPILANVYLHYVIDEWFAGTVQEHMQGRAAMINLYLRYCAQKHKKLSMGWSSHK